MRVGILTGGGDCPGINAVIRAVSKALLLQQNAEVIGFIDGFQGLIEHRYTRLDYRDVSGILTQGGTILGAHNKANPFEYVGRDGADVSDEVLDYYEELELDAVVAIGGDGTMSICHRMQQKGMDIVGVPKTIDNDVARTDRTFGFDTAASIATEAIDRLHTTAESHGRVMILETMGRYSGWIALHAGVAGGADVILIPEIPYRVDEVARVCRQRADRQKFTIVAIAEGATRKGGEMVAQEEASGDRRHVRLGGVGYALKDQLDPKLDSEIRTTVLGHVQRGGTPTPFDRVLATNYGAYAASLVAQGDVGRMVALQDNDLTSVPLAEVADQNRTVPLDSMHIASAAAVGTSFGDPDLHPDVADLGDYVSLS
ncbi:MAG: 6-phosphofructokinase [Bradymonadaceae bacterium]